MQRIANPWTSVRLREAPPDLESLTRNSQAFLRLLESDLRLDSFTKHTLLYLPHLPRNFLCENVDYLSSVMNLLLIYPYQRNSSFPLSSNYSLA
ncbi:MAG: hypothetical protein ACTH5R_11060, partial [Vibrio litoralis]